MTPTALPSNLEIQALSVLWHDGPSTVGGVLDGLADGKERAYTTVLSVMQSLERKRLVVRERSGRAHIYRPAQPREVIIGHATGEFVTNAFGGRLEEAVLAILSFGNLTPEGKTNIERELKRHKAMAAKKTKRKVAKKAVKRKVAKKVARKAVKRKVAKKAIKRKIAKKAVKRKIAKKAVKRKVAKKAVKRKVAKKAVKRKVAKKKVAKKKAIKRAVKKAAKRKTAKKR